MFKHKSVLVNMKLVKYVYRMFIKTYIGLT